MIVGIDLGTTNSAVGVWRDGQATLIPNQLGHVLTPSAVSLDERGDVLVGLAARERQVTHPALTATAFKRYMGTSRQVRLGHISFLPEELSGLVLRQLKSDAEAFLGEPVTEAVIAVPAYFNDKQRKATRRAGELAGLKVERLVNEPTAAALAYGINDRTRETTFLVFDLGGGTFDVSILEIFEGVLEVRASAGDNRLGGEDFNGVLETHMATKLDARLPLESDRLRQKVRAAAEKARRELSERPAAVMSLTWEDDRIEVPITAEEFEALSDPLIARLREPVMRAVQDGRLRLDQIDEIVLVGGATRMPIVRRAVTRMFGRFPSSAVDPDEAVGRGATIQAGLKKRDSALDEVVLTDVSPYSLGVEVADLLPSGKVVTGLFQPIIERNTTIPASRMKTFYSMGDRQSQIDLRVYQGESRHAADNILLGSLHVPIPPRPAGEVSIECRFTYDIDGLLEVDVHVPLTNERRELVLVEEEGAGANDFQARRAALAALKLHPRESEANRAAMARAGRCYEEALGPTREHVAGLLTGFEIVLEDQDPRMIEEARKELLAALDQLEGATIL